MNAPRHDTARTHWLTGPDRGELREEPLAAPTPHDVLVRTRFSGISRGTERLVRHGRVPAAVAATMRAPFQRGEFPWPVAYGYRSVGTVEAGPDELLGRDVFCLHPHADRYVVPAEAVTVLPEGVPPRRAVLAGTLETAVNACWDLAPLLGDRIAVIGAGMVGASVAALLRMFPVERLQLIDADPSKAAFAAALGIEFATPDEAAGGCDSIVHASGHPAGLARALELVADEGEVLEMSWYGDGEVPVPLGADFHSRRLSVRASQVGRISPRRRSSRSHAERLTVALQALRDPVFDEFITGVTPFERIEHAMRAVLADDGRGELCHVIDYETGPEIDGA